MGNVYYSKALTIVDELIESSKPIEVGHSINMRSLQFKIAQTEIPAIREIEQVLNDYQMSGLLDETLRFTD